MDASAGLERVLRRDRAVVASGLAGITVLAWLYLAWDASRMAAMPMALAMPWTIGRFVITFLMWSIMMVGMMVPSAAPMVLLYARVARKGAGTGSALPAIWAFTSGYLAVWVAFSLAATTLQLVLVETLLLSPMLVASSAVLSGLLLIAAGLYQWLPIKAACLAKCRSPVQFLAEHWHPGSGGAFRIGVEHGLFCVGCCWVLMLLLFVGGVMNLLWVALIAGLVLVEKLLARGEIVGRLAGVGLAGVGLWQLVGGGS